MCKWAPLEILCLRLRRRGARPSDSYSLVVTGDVTVVVDRCGVEPAWSIGVRGVGGGIGRIGILGLLGLDVLGVFDRL